MSGNTSRLGNKLLIFYMFQVFGVFGVKSLTSLCFSCELTDRQHLRTAWVLHCQHWAKLSLTKLEGSCCGCKLHSHCLPDNKRCWEISNICDYPWKHRISSLFSTELTDVHNISTNKEAHEQVFEHNGTFTRNRWIVSTRRVFLGHVWLRWKSTHMHMRVWQNCTSDSQLSRG